MTSTDWQVSAQAYLARYAMAESAAQSRAWRKAGRSMRTFRYNPTEYHRALVAALGRNDEREFKATKLEQGYASALGV